MRSFVENESCGAAGGHGIFEHTDKEEEVEFRDEPILAGHLLCSRLHPELWYCEDRYDAPCLSLQAAFVRGLI